MPAWSRATGTLALGDQVWAETDNDGVFEPQNGEIGIDGVRLDLYRDANGDGEPRLDEYFADDAVPPRCAASPGATASIELAAGNYIVVVAPSTFDGGGRSRAASH